MEFLLFLLSLGLLGDLFGGGDDADDDRDTQGDNTINREESQPGETRTLTETRDTYTGTTNDDVIRAGAGFDDMFGGNGHDTLSGEAGQDLLVGGNGFDLLYGGAWNDGLFGGVGADELYGGDGTDIVVGGAAPDILHGNTGSDLVVGGAGNDDLFGGFGDDDLLGGDGDDDLFGGAEDDFIVGGAGSDLMYGGAGDDWLVGASNFEFDVNPEHYIAFRNGEDDPLDAYGENPAVRSRELAGDVMHGDAGNDTLFVGTNDIAFGGAGADEFVIDGVLSPDAPAEVRDFDADDDLLTIVVEPGQTVTVTGNDGNVAIRVDGASVAIVGGNATISNVLTNLVVYEAV